MKRALVFILILALVLAILPAGVLAEDETAAPADPTPPAATSPAPDGGTEPSPTPEPSMEHTPPPAPSETPEPSPDAAATRAAIENARQQYQDKVSLLKGAYGEGGAAQKAMAGIYGDTDAQEKTAGGARYLVRFKNDATWDEISTILSGYDYKMIGPGDSRQYRVRLLDAETFRQACGDSIEYLEADGRMALSAITNDTLVSQQYALSLMNVPAAWNITTGSDAVYVAVIDSGIYRGHPDFAGANITNGWDLIDDTPVTWDALGHGTNVSGVIAATPNNSRGIAGICWNVSIVPFRVAYPDETIYVSDVVDAIYMAADSGCKVINLSLGGPDYTSSEANAINYAIGRGCIVVASAGNDYDGSYNYPASFAPVISAASINRYSAHSAFSNYNDRVDVSAPGEAIYTTDGTSGYASVYGTSFSAPNVAGIAALAAAVKPNITPAEFANLLATTSVDLGAAGYDPYFGYGRIDANALLTQLSISSNANLSNLAVSAGTLSPAFTPSTTNYQLRLDVQDTATITPTKSDPAAGMTMDGEAVASKTVTLNYGESRDVTITVTAHSGASRTYTITVTRPLPNGYLNGIQLSTQNLSPAFGMYTLNYTISLPEDVPGVTLTPIRNNPANRMSIAGRYVTSKAISLSPGKSTTVKIVVYETSRIKHTYTLYISRAPSTDDTLSSMSVSRGTMDKPFANGTPKYTVTVPEGSSSAYIRLYKSSSYATTYIDNRKATSKTVSVPNGQTRKVTVRVRAQAGNEQAFEVWFVRPGRVSSFSATPTYLRTPSLSPQGGNTLTFKYRVYGTAETRIEIYKDGIWRRILTRAETQGSKSYAWDGRVDGEYLPPGTYSARIYSVYDGTYLSQARTLTVNIYAAPGIGASLSTMALARGKKLSARISWNVPTNVSIQVVDGSGNVVTTLYSKANCLPSARTVYWYGKIGRTYAAPGTYRIRVTAGGTVEETGSFTIL